MKTLVILHGWGHTRKVWETFASRFPEGTTRIIELPGFGEEPLVSANWGVPEYADWARQKIENERLEGVILLGHSFGGRIAATIAANRPTWLAGLVLYGAPVLYRPDAATRAKIGLASFLKRFLPSAVSLGNAELSAARSMGLEGVFRKTIPYDLTKELPNISVPTLLLWGANDTYPSPAIAREAATLIPDARLEMIAGAGHTAHLDRPDLFYGHVARFIEHA